MQYDGAGEWVEVAHTFIVTNERDIGHGPGLTESRFENNSVSSREYTFPPTLPARAR